MDLDPELLARKTWRWLEHRIFGLVHATVRHRTRLGYALYPPRQEVPRES